MNSLRFSWSCFLLLWCACWVQAVGSLVKVETVTGEVTLLKEGKGDWQPLRVGAKLKQADKVRTAVESQASLRFENGSVLTISENTLIELKTLLESGGASNTKIGVKTGKLLFNIQKLAHGKSSFEFEAQSATAAIRGTEGDVQVRGLRSLASLLSGRLEMSSQQGRVSIGPGQMVLQTSRGFSVLPKPKDPKAYQDLVNHYLQDTSTSTDSLVRQVASKVDSLVKAGGIMLPDSVKTPPDTVKRSDSLPLNLCTLTPAPAVVSESKLRIQGTASEGMVIHVGSLQTQVSNGVWALDLAWDASQFGPKSIPVTANRGDLQISCGTLQFEFKPKDVPLALSLTTPNPVKVCKGPLLLTGSYTGSGARLQAKVGGASFDLSNATGQFQKSIVISDMTRNWDLSQVDVVLANASKSETVTLALQVDRTCPDVNHLPPALTIAAEPTQCFASLSVGNVAGDEVVVSLLSDGAEMQNFTINNDVRGRKLPLLAGYHNYVVKAVDLAGNKADAKLSKHPCWPDVRFEIKMEGGARETVRQPPPPPGQTITLSKLIRFSIRNLPNDEMGYLKRVSVKLNGRLIQEWKGMQLTSSSFETLVDLERNKVNLLHIEAEHQNGRLRTFDKEYDFK